MKIDLSSPTSSRVMGVALLGVSVLALNAVRLQKIADTLSKERQSIPPFERLNQTPQEWASNFSTSMGNVRLDKIYPDKTQQSGRIELVYRDGKNSSLPFSYAIGPDGSMMNTISVGKVVISLREEVVLYGMLEACKKEGTNVEPKLAVFPDPSHESCVLLVGSKDEMRVPHSYKLYELRGDRISFVSNARAYSKDICVISELGDIALRVYDIEGIAGRGGDDRPFVLRAPFDPRDCAFKPHITTVRRDKRLIQYVSPVGDAVSFRRACDLPVATWPEMQSTLPQFPPPEEQLRGKIPELPAFQNGAFGADELKGFKGE